MTVVVTLNMLGKYPSFKEACAIASRYCRAVLSVCLSTRFAISSGRGSFFGDNLLIPLSNCGIVMFVLQTIGCGYVAVSISRKSAGGGGGKNVDSNSLALSSFDVALLMAAIFSLYI